jgi:DNA-binding FadR family transcriptional regulator
MTKLEQYTESDRSDHEIAKAWLRNELAKTNAENTRTGKELAENVPVSVSTVRDLIQELRADGMAVWSEGRGYYVIQSAEELDRAITGIREEIATKEETMQQLCAGFNQS